MSSCLPVCPSQAARRENGPLKKRPFCHPCEKKKGKKKEQPVAVIVSFESKDQLQGPFFRLFLSYYLSYSIPLLRLKGNHVNAVVTLRPKEGKWRIRS